MMSFNDFVHKKNLKNKATSNIKIQQVLDSIGIDNAGIYLRHGPIRTDVGLVNLHPAKRTHWVCYINENYFDGYGCASPQKVSKFIIKRNGYCFYSQNQIQKNYSFWASYCLYIIYLTKLIGIDFKSTVFNFYYQKLS